ncbi:hypothetical protein D3C81_2296540 [compost metagenome]
MFARDAVHHLRQGNYSSAAISASGMLINGLGGGLFFSQYDRSKLIGLQLHLYDNFSM